MRRLSSVGVIALMASIGLAGTAVAATSPLNFRFAYAHSYGRNGLSQPYTAATTTGESFGTGVAVDASDKSQKVYSLVEASANIGVGGSRGSFPASSRTIPPSSTTPSYLGPYSIVRRTSSGAIDTSFGDDGYVSAFGTSADTSYKFTSLCVDPGTGNVVVVGNQTTSSGTVGVVERLVPPTDGSGTATLDTSFNPDGTTPGIVTIATPDGNNSPTLYGCSVVDAGTGHSGAIVVGGVDDSSSAASLVIAGKLSGSGSPDSEFGTNGVVEYPVQSVNGSGTTAEITNVSVSGAHSAFPDVILSGFSYARGTQSGGTGAAALAVAVNDSTGELDTNFNGTGELVNPAYGEAVLARVDSTRSGSDLYIVYGTTGTDAAAFVDYPITSGVPDLTNPASTATGTFTVPTDFASAQGYTFNAKGQIVVSGNTSSNQETLTEIDGSAALGY